MNLALGIVAVLLIGLAVWKGMKDGAPPCPYPGLMKTVYEHDTYEVPPDLPDTIRAVYGPRSPIEDCDGADVSQIILANRGKSIQVESSNLGGDPCGGRPMLKMLRIWTR